MGRGDGNRTHDLRFRRASQPKFTSRWTDDRYPIVYLDALYVKIREAGHVQNRAIHVVLGVTLEGRKEVLGLWTCANEGQVLAAGIDGTAQPRRGRYLHRLRGRTEGISGSDRNGLSENGSWGRCPQTPGILRSWAGI